MGASLAQAVKQPGASEKSVMEAAPYASAFFAQPVAEAQAEAVPAAKKPEETANATMTNPTAWWNLLQDQFKAAVTTAMSSEAMAGASAKATEAAAKVMAAGIQPAAKAKPAARAPAKKAAAKPRVAKPKAPKA